MKINRLFQIIYILLDRKTITAKELAEKLEVSIRTIYRDIDALSIAGIPVYTSKGKGGGIGLLDNFVLNKSLLSEKEQKEILVALQSLKATSFIESEETEVKLSRLFNKQETNWIEVDFSKWGDNESKNRFNKLKESIINCKLISFNYINSYGAKSIRKVEPLRLWFKNGDWYIQGYCLDKKEYRAFKISRILNLEELNIKFNRNIQENINLDEFKQDEEKIVDLKLLFDESISYRIYDEFDESNIKQEGRELLVSMRCELGYWLYSYILSFGSSVKVLEPRFIREKIILEIEKTLKLYKS